jgi:hypothetical protein
MSNPPGRRQDTIGTYGLQTVHNYVCVRIAQLQSTLVLPARILRTLDEIVYLRSHRSWRADQMIARYRRHELPVTEDSIRLAVDCGTGEADGSFPEVVEGMSV